MPLSGTWTRSTSLLARLGRVVPDRLRAPGPARPHLHHLGPGAQHLVHQAAGLQQHQQDGRRGQRQGPLRRWQVNVAAGGTPRQCSVGVRWDFVHKLAAAMAGNPVSVPLHYVGYPIY